MVQTQHFPLLLPDSSPVRSRLLSSPSGILSDETILASNETIPGSNQTIHASNQTISTPHQTVLTSHQSILAYFPWVLLLLLGVASLLITFLIVQDPPPSVVLSSQPNFDSAASYVPPTLEPETVMILDPSLPYLREEEDAFVIEEGTDSNSEIQEKATEMGEDPSVSILDGSTMDLSMDILDNSSEDPSMTVLDESVVDLSVASSTTVTSSLLFLLFVVGRIPVSSSFLVIVALWIRFQSRSTPQPIPSTPYHHRTSIYHPTTADLPPITPCPDSLEMNRRGTNRFDSNVL